MYGQPVPVNHFDRIVREAFPVHLSSFIDRAELPQGWTMRS